MDIQMKQDVKGPRENSISRKGKKYLSQIPYVLGRTPSFILEI